MDDKTKGQEKYLQGLELAKKGLTPDEIAKELGLFNARAWSTMKAYHGRKGLAELAAPTTANDPEPAAILEGVDCQRSEPRISVARQEGPMRADALKVTERVNRATDIATSVVAQNDPTIMDVIKAKNSGVLIGFTDPPQKILDRNLAETGARVIEKHLHSADKPKPRMAVRRVLAADGELVRYRVEGDLLQINAKGQKRAALEMGVNDARRMMEELNDFLEQVGV